MAREGAAPLPVEKAHSLLGAGARALIERGRYKEAEPLLKQAVTILNRVLPGHPFTYQAVYQLAELYRQERQFPEAESMFTTVIAALLSAALVPLLDR